MKIRLCELQNEHLEDKQSYTYTEILKAVVTRVKNKRYADAYTRVWLQITTKQEKNEKKSVIIELTDRSWGSGKHVLVMMRAKYNKCLESDHLRATKRACSDIIRVLSPS